MDKNARYWIDRLSLSPHPEGGYYRVTYQSTLTIAQGALPSAFHGDRCASTAIYFLLAENDFSAFHRLASDELWHFYTGSGLIVHVIGPQGNYSELQLGSAFEAGEVFQAVVKAGGSIVVPTFEFPGGRRFHFADGAGNVLAVWSE